MNSSGFDIDAKAEGNRDKSQVWLMLQSLLEGRFKLIVHRENRTMPVYCLTVAKNRLKLPKRTEGDCVDSPPASGQRPLGPCASATVAFEPSTGLYVTGRQIGHGGPD